MHEDDRFLENTIESRWSHSKFSCKQWSELSSKTDSPQQKIESLSHCVIDNPKIKFMLMLVHDWSEIGSDMYNSVFSSNFFVE